MLRSLATRTVSGVLSTGSQVVTDDAANSGELPLPAWGEGRGEGVTDGRKTLTPHPTPLPTGEGADRVRCRSTLNYATPAGRSIFAPLILRLLHFNQVFRANACEPVLPAAHPPNSIRDISLTASSSNASTSIAKIVPAIA